MKTTTPQKPRRIPRRWEKYYEQLLSLREHFVGSRAKLVQAAERPLDLATHDFADEANDTYEHDLAATVLRATDEILYEIDAALERIENDRYGVCEKTGKPIPERRLMAIPWTRYSTPAEAELEQEGVAPGLPVPGSKHLHIPRTKTTEE